MQLHYFKSKQGNFGDDLNEWLWGRLLPECAFEEKSETIFVGIGTIIDHFIPEGKRKIIFGSGAGYHPPPNLNGKGWEVACVRGPLTAKVLGLAETKAVTDGAILLGLLPEYAALPENQRHGVVFMPHVSALATGNWSEVCRDAGIEFLDPRDDSKKTLERIRSAKLILADAMHAAIAADTLRVPWIPAVTSAEINSFKWVDWTLSMGLSYHPTILPVSTSLEWINHRVAGLTGSRYAIPDPQNLNDVLKSYHYLAARKTSAWHKSVNKLTDRVHRLLITKAWKSDYFSSLRRHLDTGYHQKSVAALRDMATRNGYLSEEKIFRQKRDEMAKRLNDVKSTLS